MANKEDYNIEETDPEEFNVDEALARLEEINDMLSDKDIPLNESIKLYNEGTKLAGICQKHLEGVAKELKIING